MGGGAGIGDVVAVLGNVVWGGCRQHLRVVAGLCWVRPRLVRGTRVQFAPRFGWVVPWLVGGSALHDAPRVRWDGAWLVVGLAL